MYEILIDNKLVAEGKVSEDFSVAGEPIEIDDPTDFKPSNWVDDEYINEEAKNLIQKEDEFLFENG